MSRKQEQSVALPLTINR